MNTIEAKLEIAIAALEEIKKHNDDASHDASFALAQIAELDEPEDDLEVE